MNTLNEERLDSHVTVVAWLTIVYHGLCLVAAVPVLLVLFVAGAASQEPEAVPVIMVVGGFITLLLGAIAAPGIIAGLGLLARRPWARVLAIVVSALNLTNFPLGTALGAYTLWVLLQDAAGPWFARRGLPSQAQASVA